MVHRFFHIFPICFVLSEASCNALKNQVNQLMLAPQLAVAAAWHEGGTLLDLEL